MSDIDTLEAGPETDALVAEEVKGWRVEPLLNWPKCYQFRSNRRELVRVVNWIEDPDDPVYRIIDEAGNNPSGEMGVALIPTFSTEIAATWEVHEEMQRRMYSVRQRYYQEIQWAVRRRTHMTLLPAWPDVFGLIVPEDICRAALKAVRASKHRKEKP